MKHEPKKHFDISKPRRHGPDPTSKPIIVGHHPMMPDPMIREEREKVSRPISVTSDGDSPEPLDIAPTHGPAPRISSHSDYRADDTAPAEPEAKTETGPALSAAPLTSERTPGAVSPTTSTFPMASTQPTVAEMPNTPNISTSIHPLPPTAKTPEPPAGHELHIPAGHESVHHKPRVWVWVVAGLIVVIWIYGAIDALTDVELPYEFFTKVGE